MALARAGATAGVWLAALGLPLPAVADTSASFEVTASIVDGCEINGALPPNDQAVGEIGFLDFGSHSALATGPVTASLTPAAGLVLRCTPGVSLTMSTDGGLHEDGTRNLQDTAGSSRLPYRLYRDAGFSQEMLAGQASAVSLTAGEPVALLIYGRLSLTGTLPPGTYDDTVVVTLNW